MMVVRFGIFALLILGIASASLHAGSFTEDFSADVFVPGGWDRTDTSVVVAAGNGWLVIGSDSGYDDAAWKAMSLSLPIAVEARMRLVSGGLNYRLPGLLLFFADGSHAGITFLAGIVPGLHGGWQFNGWTFVETLGPSTENQWVTVKAEMRADGGELLVKYDPDPGFTPVLSRTWTLPSDSVEIKISQPWDSICNVDYVSIQELLDPPPPPSCLSATAISSSQINLVWADDSDDETGFRIERKPQGGSFSQIAVVGADSTTYVDALVGPGAYCYRVFAYNAAGESPASNEHCSTTTSATSHERIYITDFGAHRVVTADLDGSDRTEFGVAGCESYGPLSIAINPIAGKLYVSNWTEHKIIMADLDGGNARALAQLDGSIDGPNHIALDLVAGKMYIANENTNSVTVANLDGSSPVVLDLGGTLNEPYGIALDIPSGKMYVQNYSGAIVNVVQANLDGSSPVVMDLDGKLSNSRDIALDLVARKMYAVNTGTNSVTRANLDGTCAEVLNLGGTLSLPYGIALDVPAGKMYVINYGTDNVVVANLDGSDAHVLALEGVLSACNDIELGPNQQAGVAPPTATTAPATGVTSSAATLRGTVNAHGTAATVTFEYGLTDTYGTVVTADQSPVAGDTDTAVTVSTTGLTPNTTYHYRVIAQNSGGTAYGEDATFSTGALAPTAVTTAATEITATTATLNGTVNANSDQTTVTFHYGLTPSYGSVVTAVQSPLFGSTDTAVTTDVKKLTPNTTYYYRVTAQNSVGTTLGEGMTYSTLLLGDINGDGLVDLIDVLMLYRYVEGALELSSVEVARSDIDGDGDVDEDDAVALASIVYGS